MEKSPAPKKLKTSTPDQPVPTRRALHLDVAHYQTYLEGDDLDEAQKRSLVGAMWAIMVAFVDLGFDIQPLQGGAETCDKVGKSAFSASLEGQNAVNSADTKNKAGDGA